MGFSLSKEAVVMKHQHLNHIPFIQRIRELLLSIKGIRVKSNYDLVIITNIPSFYKCLLFQKLSEQRKILIIFLAASSNQRHRDFYPDEMRFNHEVIWGGDFQSRPVLENILKIRKILNSVTYTRVLVQGWDCLEYWYACLKAGKEESGVIVESSIFETKTSGFLGGLKKIFMKLVSIVVASGVDQERLTRALGYQGRVVLSGGVGVIPEVGNELIKKRVPEKVVEFICAARLIPIKNIAYLVETFKGLPSLNLTIAGDGPEFENIRKIATNNVHFLGHVENQKLRQILPDYDVFVLPSRSEPWGLVVDEALCAGLPIIVSDYVGCRHELVETPGTGLVFDLEEPATLKYNVLLMTNIYNYRKYFSNVAKFNYKKRTEKQVSVWVCLA